MWWCCTSSAKAWSNLNESRTKVESCRNTISFREAKVGRLFAAVDLSKFQKARDDI